MTVQPEPRPAAEPEGSFTAPAAAVLTSAVLLALFAVFRGPYILWSLNGRALVPAGSYVFLLAALLGVLSLALRRARGTGSAIDPVVLCLGPLAVWGSDWLCHTYSFFQAPSIRGELIVAACFAYLVFARGWKTFFSWWLVLGCVALFWSFLAESAGEVIFSDDHASVFYRLTLLKNYFPNIPFYNTDWNAGHDARDFFSTGILNLYLLASPLLAFFRVEEVYNLLIGGVLFVLFPASVYFAAQLFRLDRLSSVVSSLVALAVSLVWYRWALKYGSMGFVTSVTLLPFNVGLALRILDEKHVLSKKEVTLFVTTFSLMLFWTMTGIVFLPIILLAIARARTMWRAPRRRTILFALLVINLPWIIVWLRVANVFHFVLHPGPSAVSTQTSATTLEGGDDSRDTVVRPETKKRDRRRGVGNANEFSRAKLFTLNRNFAVNSNVLLIFFGIPGIMLLTDRRARVVYCLTGAWLLFLGTAVSQVKPQLELERMLVVFAVLLSIPAGRALGLLFQRASAPNCGRLSRALASVAAAFVIVGVLCSGAVVRNRTLEQYSFTDSTVKEMVSAIDQYGGPGRVLYTGFVLHELNRGHLAPLAYYTNHPLVASSPKHDTWWYTDIIPEFYRDTGPQEVERFLDAMNTTAVMAHEPFWRDYFESQPDRYRFVWEAGRFKMYQRTGYTGNYFLEGSGEVRQETNRLQVRVDSTEAVIKFHYFPFLKSSACTLLPYHLPGEVDLIKIANCQPGRTVTITAESGFARVIS